MALWPKAPPPAPRVVVFDAVPWATVESIQDSQGERVTLAADATTPFVLSLRPGTYRVVVAGPPPALERRTVELVVRSDGAAAFPVQRFTPMTTDEYFKDLLPAAAPPPEIRSRSRVEIAMPMRIAPARAVVAAVAALMLLSTAPSRAQEGADKVYKDGLEAIEKQRWAEAASAMRGAIGMNRPRRPADGLGSL